MLEILACVQPCRDKEFEELTPLLFERASMLSGAICIFLAWDQARQRLVRQMQALGVPLLVFVITDQSTPPIEPGMMDNISETVHVLTAGQLDEKLRTL
jgi:hypothetical protein